jgi:hypothetical protein
MQKGISYRLQNPKKSAKLKVYCMRCSITLLKFAKRDQIPFGAVAKGNLLPGTFWITLHAESTNCMHRRSCFAIPLIEHKLEYRNGGEI